MPTLEPVDESFFASAPERYSDTFAIARPAEQVWDDLVADEPLAWCRGLSLSWTSERPFGVGTTRRAASLGGAIKLKERYFIWEDAHRQAFYVTHANLPALQALRGGLCGRARRRRSLPLHVDLRDRADSARSPRGAAERIHFRRMFGETRRHYGAS